MAQVAFLGVARYVCVTAPSDALWGRGDTTTDQNYENLGIFK